MSDGTQRQWVFPVEAKVDAVLPDGTHRYWSTHCRHDHHIRCSATEIRRGGGSVPREPAQCKTCAAPCLCHCHDAVRDASESITNPVTGESLGVVVSGETARVNKVIEERQRGRTDDQGNG